MLNKGSTRVRGAREIGNNEPSASIIIDTRTGSFAVGVCAEEEYILFVTSLGFSDDIVSVAGESEGTVDNDVGSNRGPRRDRFSPGSSSGKGNTGSRDILHR